VTTARNAEQNPFQELLRASVKKFAETAAKIVGAMLSAKCALQSIEIIDHGLSVEKTFFVSILFTGTVYGEYVLSMDEDVAAKFLGKESTEASDLDQLRLEMSETFCEILNVVVGESILSLGDQYKKLTITAPRVYFGRINYPKVKTGKAILTTDKGTIECYLYVDRMKLDIAASYMDALASLLKAHKELLAAMNKLKEQQTLLVQSEKMAALGTMAAGVAHEINTPLAAVMILGGQLKDMVNDQRIDKKSFFDTLDMIEKTVTNISRITNGLKTYARGIGGESFSFTSISQIIENTLALCEQHLKENGIKVHISTLPNDLKLKCRGSQISQVLVSVITNAVDAIAKLNDKWIKVDVVDQGEVIQISVTDSGLGIPSEVRDKIFDPFFTTKGIGGGTGLGLSISKGVVDDHFGNIFVDPKAPNTCVVIKLPKAHKQVA
jgi:signal transduction histidine kinase